MLLHCGLGYAVSSLRGSDPHLLMCIAFKSDCSCCNLAYSQKRGQMFIPRVILYFLLLTFPLAVFGQNATLNPTSGETAGAAGETTAPLLKNSISRNWSKKLCAWVRK
jgi:hypothetical protein